MGTLFTPRESQSRRNQEGGGGAGIETPAIKAEDEVNDKKQNTNLSRFLEYLLKVLQKKDSNNFFAVPVNDQFAPGYSQIIKTPMDFSTMRSKVMILKDV